MPKAAGLSPGRRQYLELKRRHPGSLLLVRMGDFYETFDEDARTMARVLDIVLTSRDVGSGIRSPLAGIPHHSLDSYLGRLIKAGHRVAVCEQTSDAAASHGLVDRAVVRIVTPGTVLDPGLLEQGRNNYLAAVVTGGSSAGVAYVDISTSEFSAGEVALDSLPDELARIGPAEVLADAGSRSAIDGVVGDLAVRSLDESRLDPDLAARRVLDHFGVATLEGFGFDGRPLAVTAAGAVLEYLAETQVGTPPQITELRPLGVETHVRLDRRAWRDLELFEPMGPGVDGPTLLSTIDRTRTPMGGRKLHSWLERPLLDLPALRARQDGVEKLFADAIARARVRTALAQVPDLERLTNRVRTMSAGPRELFALGRGLAHIPEILEALPRELRSHSPASGGPWRGTPLKPCDDVVALLRAAIADDPPATLGEGRAVRPGFDAELDETRSLADEAREHIARVETEAREATDIKSLKVGYNKVFGYYIEVSNPNLDRVPPEFERRQTLTGAERFITPRLKELESKILSAQDRIGDLERAIFGRVCVQVSSYGERVMAAAASLSEIDVLAALAEAAAIGRYVRPELNEGDTIEIIQGRHPVVESMLGPGRFVPNDLRLSSSGEQLHIITGPNMSGKSTYIRQVALLVLLAHIGSFVPAERASIGLVDRIFTRAGLSDDIAGGRSTFMIEMVETAAILHQATPRSLILLDEIGRGTSTYDGLAIARAVAEHIHDNPRLRCKTLFATHYHEMTELASLLPRAANYRVAVAEEGDEVTFLHRIVPGGADRSYGVHVGRLAGLPRPVVARAWDILEELEAQSRRRSDSGVQLTLLSDRPAIADELAALALDEMTPIEALNALYALKESAARDGDS